MKYVPRIWEGFQRSRTATRAGREGCLFPWTLSHISTPGPGRLVTSQLTLITANSTSVCLHCVHLIDRLGE